MAKSGVRRGSTLVAALLALAQTVAICGPVHAAPSAGEAPTIAPFTASAPSAAPFAAAAAASAFVPLTPARLFDSRPGEATIDHLFEGVGRVAPRSVTEIQVVDRAGVAADASAVVLNVTAVGASSPGYLTVYPCGEAPPLASNVNYLAGGVVANAVVAKVGDGGRVCVFSLAASDLVVDVNGWFGATSGLSSLVPARLFDSRPGAATIDHLFEAGGRVGRGSITEVPVADRGGVGAEVSAAVLNVTAVGASGPGYLTVFPCGEERPLASNVNYRSAVAVPNAVVAKVGDGGRVCVYSSSETDLVVDVNGWFGAGAPLSSLTPARVFESRPGEATVDHEFEGAGRLAAGSVTEVQIAGRGGVGPDASAVVLNVTGVGATSAGYLTVFPCDEQRPLASNVNHGADEVVANAVVAKVGAGGRVCVFSLAATDLVVDVTAWFGPGGTAEIELGASTITLPGDEVVDAGDGAAVLGADQAPEVGGYLALGPSSGQPHGSLGRVTGVTDNADGTVSVTTEPAMLEEAFPSGHIEYQGSLQPIFTADAPQSLIDSYHRTGRLPAAALPGFTCNRGEAGIEARFEVSVGVTADVLLDWGANTHVRFVLGLSLGYDASVALTASRTCEYQSPSVLGWTVMVGGVPIAVSARTIADLTAQVEGISIEREGTISLEAGGEFKDGRWEKVFGLRSESSPWIVSGALRTGSVSMFAGPALTGMVFGVVGLTISVGPEVSVGVNQSGGDYRCEVTAAYRLAVDAEIGKWFLTAKARLGATSFARVSVGAKVCGTVPKPRVVTSTLDVAVQNGSHFVALVAEDGVAPYTWSMSGAPAGLRIEGSAVTGSPATAGDFNVVLQVTDSAGRSATRTVPLRVNALTPEQRALFGRVVTVGSASHYIDLRGSLHPIPSGGVYECLVAQGKQVVAVADISMFPRKEDAACVRAEIGDVARISGNRSYLVADGWKARSIPDGGTVMCLQANGAEVIDVPVYWLYDLGFGPDYQMSCWNATQARGRTVRASNGSSWYIDKRGGRHSVPDGGVYECLVAQGKAAWPHIVPLDWVDDLTAYEAARCVRAEPGNIIRHNDGDAYLINADWTRSWIRDGGSYECMRLNGRTVVPNVPRYYIDDLVQGADATMSCWNATSARGRSVRASDGTSWYIDLRGGRHWMPDGGTYECIVAQGKSAWPYVVPISWVDDLPEYEHAKCVRANPGNVIRHDNGDAYLINPNWTRSWIRDGGIFNCLSAAGRPVVTSVPRYYIDDLAPGTDLTFCPADRILRMSDGTAWYVGNDLIKRPITSGGTYLCLTEWKGKQVVSVNQTQANLFDTGPAQTCTVTEANGRIIRVGSASWYVENSVRRPIPNGGTFLCLTEWNGVGVMNVSQNAADALPVGSNMTCTPSGAADRVLRQSDGTSWYVDGNNVRHHIPNSGTYNCVVNVRGKSVTNNVSAGRIDALARGEDYRCRAILHMGDYSFYVDSSGYRFLIPNSRSQDPYVCLRNKPGVFVRAYTTWAQIDALGIPDRTGVHAGCHYD